MNVTCSCHNIAVKLPTTITSQTNNSHCLTEPQGIPQQPSTGQIVRLITIFACYFVFKNENVKVKVKYSFVLHSDFVGSPLLL